jgi:hypothetical protein
MTDPSEIVKSLRTFSYVSSPRFADEFIRLTPRAVLWEAASLIEAQQEEITRFREALEQIADGFSDPDIRDIARSALEKKLT